MGSIVKEKRWLLCTSFYDDELMDLPKDVEILEKDDLFNRLIQPFRLNYGEPSVCKSKPLSFVAVSDLKLKTIKILYMINGFLSYDTLCSIIDI